MKFSKLIQRILYNHTYKYLISNYLKEVEDDIKILKHNNLYYNNSNSILNCFYQDDDRFDEDEELLIEIKKITAKKYKEKYCPTCLFNYFNQSEKANYIMLRIEIDKFLGIKDTSYQI